MEKTFGEIYFEKIDSNEYLNSLYEDILYNYAQKLFGFSRNNQRQISVENALRFADILSKSTHSSKQDLGQPGSPRITLHGSWQKHSIHQDIM